MASDLRHGRLRLFVRACLNPLVILLAVLAAISVATGDARAAAVMAIMIVLGVSLRFAQEARADAAAEKLRLPFSPVGPALGFTHLPDLYWPLLILTLFSYVTLTQVVKAWLHRRQLI